MPTMTKLNFTKSQQETAMMLKTKSYCERSVCYHLGLLTYFYILVLILQLSI